MSRSVYSVGTSAVSPGPATSQAITVTGSVLQDFAVDGLLLACRGQGGSVTVDVQRNGTSLGSGGTYSLDPLPSSPYLWSVPLTGHGIFNPDKSFDAGQTLTLTVTPGNGAEVLVESVANAGVSGLSTTPELSTASNVTRAHPMTNLDNKHVAWTNPTDGVTFPVGLLTVRRQETVTPAWFQTLGASQTAYSLVTNLTTTDLGGAAVSGALWGPPLSPPATFAATDTIELKASFGQTALQANLDPDTLWYATPNTPLQPRLTVHVNATGTGARLTADAFQVFQDLQGHPGETLCGVTTAWTTVPTDQPLTFSVGAAASTVNTWTYDPQFGTALNGHVPRVYNEVEAGVWGWNFGPGAAAREIAEASALVVNGPADRGGGGWPASVAHHILDVGSAPYVPGTSLTSTSVGTALSVAHRAPFTFGWGTGTLGSGYAAHADVVPYALRGPVSRQSWVAKAALGQDPTWTPTADTATEPMFSLGSRRATTTGNGVLFVPHYIDASRVLPNAQQAPFVPLSVEDVLAGTAVPASGVLNVVPAHYGSGDVSDRAQGQTWANAVLDLMAHPNVATVATSSLHVALGGLASNKAVVITKFGDLVRGGGVKFQDALEQYAGVEPNSFLYTEPDTLVLDPGDLSGVTVASVSSHANYTLAFKDDEAAQGALSCPYQGLVSFARYVVH